jgi:hypothetical protein
MDFAFPLGATADRIELYVTTTEREAVEDLAAAVEGLIRTHQTTRAPAVAQVLDRCRDARRARLERCETPQLAAHADERATVEDFQRIRELGSYGIFWDPARGEFREWSMEELARLRGPCEAPREQRRPDHTVTRAALNAEGGPESEVPASREVAAIRGAARLADGGGGVSRLPEGISDAEAIRLLDARLDLAELIVECLMKHAEPFAMMAIAAKLKDHPAIKALESLPEGSA